LEAGAASPLDAAGFRGEPVGMKKIAVSDDDISSRIWSFIVENFLFGEERELDGSASLLESGILDSTGVLELVSFLETNFRIQVADTEMVVENLDSLENISRFVSAKLAGG
jgi:acyl carrier protein